MQGQVSVTAQRDQVLLGVIPGLTAKFLLMNLEVFRAPAGLTSPSIPLQDFSTKLLERCGIQSRAWLLRSNLTHGLGTLHPVGAGTGRYLRVDPSPGSLQGSCIRRGPRCGGLTRMSSNDLEGNTSALAETYATVGTARVVL